MSSILFLSNDFLEIWMWMNYVNDTRNVEVVRALKNKNSHVFYILNVWKICFQEKGKTFWTKKTTKRNKVSKNRWKFEILFSEWTRSKHPLHSYH